MPMKAFMSGLFVFCLLFVFTSQAYSTDSGPESITLKSSDSNKKPPAVFPHKMHQESLDCGECHHTMVDGKQAPYTEGMEIKTCESCHNPELLAGKKKGKNKLDTFKGAGHGNCLDCHKEVAKEDSSKKKLKSCSTCHQK